MIFSDYWYKLATILETRRARSDRNDGAREWARLLGGAVSQCIYRARCGVEAHSWFCPNETWTKWGFSEKLALENRELVRTLRLRVKGVFVRDLHILTPSLLPVYCGAAYYTWSFFIFSISVTQLLQRTKLNEKAKWTPFPHAHKCVI